MSTEHQQYSIENQLDAIARYAKERLMEVVRTYTDGGRSGLTIQHRVGLRQLIQDVESGSPDFSAILVYDVSRWGRFQDADESAYYEYRCKQANIRVHYCAEPFANDGSISSALLKALKRTMAGEFSRELSAKVFAGKCRLIELGFWQGGRAGYGLRRLVIDRNGKVKGILNSGEYKNLSTDRVVLIPGPPEEVAVVQEIYRRFTDDHESMPMIAAALNNRGVANEKGGLWTRDQVSGVLTNPKYTGANITNRKSMKLKTRAIKNPRDMWVGREAAFPALVSTETYKNAQQALAERNRSYEDDELLGLLSALLSRTGRLSAAVIDEAGGMPTSKGYHIRFGGLLGAYRRIGYTPKQDYSYVNVAAALPARHQDRIAALASYLEGLGAIVSRDLATDLITVNSEIRVRFMSAFCYRYGPSGHRWFLEFASAQPYDIAVVARLGPDNEAVLDYFIVPCSEGLRNQTYNGSVTHALNLYRFGDLSVFKALVRRRQLSEEP